MELELALRVMDLLASHYESLKERLDSAEARIKDLECAGECSCQTWREHTGAPKDEILGLTESFKDMHK